MTKWFTYLLFSSFLVYGHAQTVHVEISATAPPPEKLEKVNYPTTKTAIAGLREYIDLLHTKGYLSANIDSLHVDTPDITAHIHYGPKYQLTHLNTTRIDEEILTQTGFRDKQFLNKPFRVSQINNFFKNTIELLENTGYPFCQIYLTDVSFQEGNVTATVILEKGPFYKIDAIEIVGDDIRLNENYVYNTIRIKPNTPYSEQLIADISNRIRENPYLQETRINEVIFTESTCKVVLFVKNEKANVFDGILGVQPQENSDDIVITGDVSISLGNIIGQGERIQFNWQQLQDQTQQIDAGAHIPFLFRTPIGFGYDLEIYRRDSTFNNVSQKFTVPFSLANGTTFSGFFHTFNSTLINTAPYENSPSLPPFADAKNTQYGIGYSLEKTNNRFNPIRGWQITFSGGFGRNEIIENPNLELVNYDSLNLSATFLSSQLLVRYFQPLRGASTLLFQFRGATMQSENLVDNQLYRIGGLHSIRGFDQQSILASSYTIGTLEYRFLFDELSRISVFCDAGWHENQSIQQFATDIAIGFGAGIGFATNAGIFNLSYALGTSKQQDLSFRTGKIHFGFVNIF